MADLFIALVHYPVLDRNARIVTSAITSLDLHDLARSARTYGVRRFFIVHPVAEQRAFATSVIGHWQEHPGRVFDSRRAEALALAQVVGGLDEAIAIAETQSGSPPTLVATSARTSEGISYESLRGKLDDSAGSPVLLLFGTGFGLAPEIMRRANLVLAPIRGVGDYNHLSVRAAVTAILDRLRGI
ncbi:MAG: RNA methyltransferase [Candidatus Binataceae bacterium]|nr:RNA methyltransferase [Candidatus Binataceae bacterium]